MPDQPSTIIAALLHHADARPEAAFITFEAQAGQRETWSFKQTLERAQRSLASLQARDLKAGARVLIAGSNEPETVAMILGAMGGGYLPAIVHPPLRADSARARDILQRLVDVATPELIAAPRQLHAALSGNVEICDSSQLSPVTGDQAQLTCPDANATAYLQFSSGSTGDQKAVMISAEAMATNAAAIGTAIKVREQETWIGWMPLYHDMGLMTGLLVPLYFGHRTVLLTPEAFVSKPLSWMRAISDYHGTISGAPNFAYALSARRARSADVTAWDLSNLRVLFNGAEPVEPDTIEEFEAAFAASQLRPQTVLPVYGLAEFTLAGVFWHVGQPQRVDLVARESLAGGYAGQAPVGERRVTRQVSVGVALAGHEMRIVNAHGQTCDERDVGEVELRGPSRMQGYWQNTEATEAVLHDGWLQTGDLGYIANGELFICGRKKDVIVRFGENVFPTSLEAVANQVSGVKQGRVAAFGVPDSSMKTERLWMIVECNDDLNTASELVRRVRDYVLAATGIRFDGVSALPFGFIEKTSSGKVRRFRCFDKLDAMYRESTPPPSVGRWPMHK